jgi:GNAT superfamily N-acetyltransferase
MRMDVLVCLPRLDPTCRPGKATVSWVSLEASPTGQYIALVVDVVVDESFRGQGVGSSMLRHLTHELSGVEEILLGCEEELVPFYEKLGWAGDDGAVLTYERQAS